MNDKKKSCAKNILALLVLALMLAAAGLMNRLAHTSAAESVGNPPEAGRLFSPVPDE